MRQELALAVTGVVLCTGLAVWTVVSARAAGVGQGGGVVLALLTIVLVAFGRLTVLRNGWELPLGVAAGGLAVALGAGDGLLGNASSPLGYANATAALFLLATAASLVVAARCPLRPVRLGCLGLAAVFASIPLTNGSRTAAALLVLLPLGLLSARGAVHRLLAGGAVAVAVVVGATVTLGLAYDPVTGGGPLPRVAASVLTERRLALWHDALAVMRDHPLRGVGPGGLAAYSPTIRDDPDAKYAHSAYLQVGAETGVPGLLLLVALVGWGFAHLRLGDPDAGTGVAGMALTASAVHAGIDYVWGFPAVLLTVALLVGAGRGGGRVA